jgi:hypothetical protein
MLPPDSPGSSVSTRLQDEYDELLRFAVVVPSYNPSSIPRTLQDFRGSFPVVNNNSQTLQSNDVVPDVHNEDEGQSYSESFLYFEKVL